MKNLTIILLLSLTTFSFSQNDTLTFFEKANLFTRKQCDSLFKIRKQLINGKYTIYFDKEKQHIAKIFYLENGNVTNLYREYTVDGYLTTGYYKNDSIWTFYKTSTLFNKNNSFKRGLWAYMIGYQINLGNEQFKMDFDKDSLFNEVWLYQNDNTRNIRKHHQRLGLIYEAGFSLNGNMEYENIKYPNSTLYKEFDSSGNLINLQLMEEIGIEIQLNKSQYYYPIECKKSITIRKSFAEKDFRDKLNSTIYLDENNKIILYRGEDLRIDFSDLEKTISYKKRKKYKKIRIKNKQKPTE